MLTEVPPEALAESSSPPQPNSPSQAPAAPAGRQAPVKHGGSKENYPNGDSYEGIFIRGQRHGEGIYYYANGGRYEGQFQANNMHGDGVCYYVHGKNKEVYDGEWCEGQRHGKGKYTYCDGAVYVGRWQADMREGKGKMTFVDGTIFKGTFVDDVRQGDGKLLLPDLTKYEGEFKNDKRHGKGVTTDRTGSRHEGEYIADFANHEGKLYNGEEKSSYVGQFRGGARMGKGRCYYYESGKRFVGTWMQDFRQDGHTILPDGRVFHEIFQAGTAVTRELIGQADCKKYVEEADAAEMERAYMKPDASAAFDTGAPGEEEMYEDDKPRYKVQVAKFAKSSQDLSKLMPKEDDSD